MCECPEACGVGADLAVGYLGLQGGGVEQEAAVTAEHQGAL